MKRLCKARQVFRLKSKSGSGPWLCPMSVSGSGSRSWSGSWSGSFALPWSLSVSQSGSW